MVTNDGLTAAKVRDLRELAERRQWPAGTSTLTPLDFDLTFSGRSFRLSILDYPGEDLLRAMETMDFESKELIYEHICKADCLLIITDPTQDLNTELNPDVKATRRRQDALAQAIGLLVKERETRELPAPLVGVVVTKSDLLEANRGCDKKSVFNANRGLIKKLQAYARNRGTIPLFTVSACGAISSEDVSADPSTEYPVDPKPHGYEKLFVWISTQTSLKRELRKYKTHLLYALALLFMVFVAGVFFVVQKNQGNRELMNAIRSSPVIELHPLLEARDTLSSEAQKNLDERLDRVFSTMDSQFAAATSADDLKRLQGEVSVSRDLPFNARKGDFENLLDSIERRMEDALFRAIESAVRSQSPDEALELIVDYRNEFPKGAHQAEVDSFANQLRDQKEKLMRDRARSVRISTRDSLARKVAATREYLKSFPDSPERSVMEQALKISGRLSSADEVRLVFRGCGFSGTEERRHEVKWILDRKILEGLTFTCDEKRNRSTFEQKLEVPFAQWNGIHIQLWDLKNRNEIMANGRLNVLRDLQDFDGGEFMMTPAADDAWINVKAWLKIDIELRSSGSGGWSKVGKPEIDAYSKYIYPGDNW